MNAILQIAWREYRQYVFSRGFLLFLILFPVGFVVGAVAFSWAERQLPTRHFAVFDETGLYAEAIDREIDILAARRSLSAWDTYLELAAKKDALDAAVEEDAIPEPFAPGPVTTERATAFVDAGGAQAAIAAVRPYLRDGAPAFMETSRGIVRVDLPASAASADSLEAAADALRPFLNGERPVIGPEGAPVDLFAAVLIPAGFTADGGDDAPEAQYWSRNLTDNDLRGAIARALDRALSREKLETLGVDADVLDDLLDTDAPIADFRPDRDEEEAELGVRDRVETIIPGVLTYMLVFIIMGVGNLLLTNTIEERSNKIVEILLSSVTANQLMMGKLIGIGAVGLTMPTIFVLVGGLLTFVAPGANELVGGIGSILFSTPLFAIYLFYFFCAYFIFAMIFLAIGAVSNSLQDAQSYMGPVTLSLFAPLPLVLVMYQNPNGVIATILTWIPIYTPYAVLLRVASDPPLWEILGATAFMLLFAYVLARLMGRVFRRAILSSGPVKLSEAFKLLVSRED
ncbi:MAG: ABC transporter permease [Pseudomonadota bacterium]